MTCADIALLSVGDGHQLANVDPEAYHEKDEVDIEAWQIES